MAITSSVKQKPSSLWRALKAYQIYGANTDVGKTIVSTILCRAFARRYPHQNTWYLKPVSTGPLSEADDGHVSKFSSRTKTRCLFQFDEPVSPHIAARSKPVSIIQPFELDKQLKIDSDSFPTARFWLLFKIILLYVLSLELV